MRCPSLPTILLLTVLAGCERTPDSVLGEPRQAEVTRGGPIADVARELGVGVPELARANPALKAGHVPAGVVLRLPTEFVLPQGPRRGIVVNIAEMRLYYFGEDGLPELSFPVSVGRDEWETPTGTTEIVERITDPPWHPPDSIREDQLKKGNRLPEVVPPGPDNPLGRYALRLGWGKHLIHGTNQPYSVGRPVTHGCMRLYPEHMAQLFERVAVGTPVTLVDEPVKLGERNGALYLEAHASPNGGNARARSQALARIRQWAAEHPRREVDLAAAQRALAQATGLPQRISDEPHWINCAVGKPPC